MASSIIDHRSSGVNGQTVRLLFLKKRRGSGVKTDGGDVIFGLYVRMYVAYAACVSRYLVEGTHRCHSRIGFGAPDDLLVLAFSVIPFVSIRRAKDAAKKRQLHKLSDDLSASRRLRSVASQL